VPFFDGVTDFVGDALGHAAAADAAAAAQAPKPAFTGAAGILRIEPDQVDAAIKVFRDAVYKLERRVRQAQEEVRADPMAEDLVSQPAAAAFNHASLSGPRAAIAAWTGAVKELESIVRQLQVSKESMVRTDDIASQPFSSAAGGMS
jgi:hypothetical protein